MFLGVNKIVMLSNDIITNSITLDTAKKIPGIDIIILDGQGGILLTKSYNVSSPVAGTAPYPTIFQSNSGRNVIIYF